MPELSVAEFTKTACYVLIFTFLWRAGAAKLHDRPVGRAMAAVYS